MIQKTLPDKKVTLFFTGLVPGGQGTPEERLAPVKPFADHQYNLVIIQNGEHENPQYGGVEGWKATYEKLLGMFERKPEKPFYEKLLGFFNHESEKPFVISAGVWAANHGDGGLQPGVMGGFWKEIPEAMAEISQEHGVPFVPLMDIAADPDNRGWEPKPDVLWNAGVQWHPNDRGHRLIAEKIFKTFTDEVAKRAVTTKAQ